MRKILYVLVGAVLWVSSLLSPVAASAAPACPAGQVDSHGRCTAQIDRDTTCIWPMQLGVKVVTYCTRLDVGL